jgi:hypothetical protein
MREDGEYNLEEVKPLSVISPEAADIYSDASTRETVIGVVSGTGGGFLGFALADQIYLASGGEPLLSDEVRVGFYVAAGTLLVAGIVMTAAWHDPGSDFADSYNCALKEQLVVSLSSSGETSLRIEGEGLTFRF